MLLDHGQPLLAGVLKGNLRLLEPLTDLLLPPLGYHVLLLLLLCMVPLPAARLLGAAGLLVVALHVLVAARMGGISVRELADILLRVPLYLLWKVRMVFATLRTARQGSAWVRTERDMKIKETE
jgi:hypothetical protein